MRAQIVAIAVSVLAQAASAAVEAKNVIYVIPDGWGPASQTLARDLQGLIESGTNRTNPIIGKLAVDDMVNGLVRTYSANRLITDSAAGGTALATGHKTNNGWVGVTPDRRPVGSILEAAKLAGLGTGLVSTTAITHATPGAYSAHTVDRNNQNLIAEQQLGRVHPLGSVVDVLLGGGRCNFLPQGAEGSCREDDIDLYAYAEELGWSVARNRSEFDEFERGLGAARLPILGNFASGDMRLEIDRREVQDEPSLLEMSQTAVQALHRATHCKDKGYFVMIESAKLDTSGHAGDVPAHAVGTWHFNEVMKWLSEWIDEHPDTILISSSDHETGGLTLVGNYDPTPAFEARHTANFLANKWNGRPEDADSRQFLVDEILPYYALTDAMEGEIEELLETDDMEDTLTMMLSQRVGAEWSTGGHSAIDVTLFSYAAGDKRRELQADLARNWNNIEIPRYIEEVLGLDMDSVTELLQEAAEEDDSWLGDRLD
ncbi:alkaline phosphatase [Stachybotrys elegans]|uniref:Alkaline phosphatase n=1 Tax=Stachybotrys elegans TaxID=80388 RepID=A0A8K0WS14_9HYPO|nr:alkaline phosphatase [Stachybotrys elegans]